MAGKLTLNQVQLGDSGTATQNFVWQTNVDGTCKLSRGNTGAITQDILTVDATGKITNVQGFPNISASALPSMIRLNTANGYGSTNTMIRRFTNVVTSQGADITYVDSAALGASFTVNATGVYSISYCDNFSSASQFGLSLNSSQLTTSIFSITAATRLAMGNTLANIEVMISNTVALTTGDVIRAHTSAIATGSASVALFTITRVA